MSRKFALAIFVHSLRSDWNNGNAHFLRGLARSLLALGHQVTCFERAADWSINSLREHEQMAEESLDQFADTYPELAINLYAGTGSSDLVPELREALRHGEIVIVHEWNSPELISALLALREELHFQILFHDTHHRASSSPTQIRLLQIDRFDGVLAFGEALRQIYLRDFGIENVWTFHEAADTSVFYPRNEAKTKDVVWIGNWGDEERSKELREYLVRPAATLASRRFAVYGVRYPEAGLRQLEKSGIEYGGYLPNLQAPSVYASARLTLHIPRQQYTVAMAGIPTIRVFEALASGIPLISAPWRDIEGLFAAGDLTMVESEEDMTRSIEHLLDQSCAALEQAARGLETVRARHTCHHRAEQLTSICEELFA
jgi:spore maturation protein CgeB